MLLLLCHICVDLKFEEILKRIADLTNKEIIVGAISPNIMLLIIYSLLLTLLMKLDRVEGWSIIGQGQDQPLACF